jgi:hypothetical protein
MDAFASFFQCLFLFLLFFFLYRITQSKESVCSIHFSHSILGLCRCSGYGTIIPVVFQTCTLLLLARSFIPWRFGTVLYSCLQDCTWTKVISAVA